MTTLPQVLGCQRDGSRVKLDLAVPADLQFFDGHFPQHPILPGVVQVAWAVQYGREHFALPPSCRRMSGIKFQNVIRPLQRLALELDYEAASGELAFRYIAGDAVFSSGRLRFAADGA